MLLRQLSRQFLRREHNPNAYKFKQVAIRKNFEWNAPHDPLGKKLSAMHSLAAYFAGAPFRSKLFAGIHNGSEGFCSAGILLALMQEGRAPCVPHGLENRRRDAGAKKKASRHDRDAWKLCCLGIALRFLRGAP